MGEDANPEDEAVELPIDGILDLHTFRPRDVKDLVPDYLDECQKRDITEVRIIHGKGKGVLRRTVHAVLERRDDVAEYGLAPPHRGGWGATLVTLRRQGDPKPANEAPEPVHDQEPPQRPPVPDAPAPKRSWTSRIKAAVRWPLTISMVWVGILHFVDPEPFVRIVPDYLPAPEALVYISGVFEILGGVGLLFERTRRFSAYGLIALFVAVFPANVHMALNEVQLEPGGDIPAWAMWARLPFQLVFIALAWWMTREDPAPPPDGG